MEIEMKNSKPYINGHEAVGIIHCIECAYAEEDKTDGQFLCLCPEPMSIYGHPLGIQKVKGNHFCGYAIE